MARGDGTVTDVAAGPGPQSVICDGETVSGQTGRGCGLSSALRSRPLCLVPRGPLGEGGGGVNVITQCRAHEASYWSLRFKCPGPAAQRARFPPLLPRPVVLSAPDTVLIERNLGKRVDPQTGGRLPAPTAPQPALRPRRRPQRPCPLPWQRSITPPSTGPPGLRSRTAWWRPRASRSWRRRRGCWVTTGTSSGSSPRTPKS